MSYLRPPVTTPSMNNYDEHHWVVQIRRTLEEEDEEEKEIPVSIFNVPKTLMSSNPELYIPQLVALGPYHHWREEIFEMERYKLDAAKRTQKRLRDRKFHSLVDDLLTLEPRIRACYHKYLDCSGETLAWMMAIDVAFLLEVLQTYIPIKEGNKCQSKVSLRMSHLVDYSGRKSAFNIILKDIIMLENQIPLFLLRKVLESEHDSLEVADEVLSSMLVGLCRELSPFNMVDFPCTNISNVSHLLDFLYQNIVQKTEVQSDNVEEEISQENHFHEDASVSRFHLALKWLIQKLHKGSVLVIERVLSLFWLIISKIPICSLMSEILQNTIPRDDKDMKSDYSNNTNKPPLVEEIMIPSVTELFSSGVQFLTCNGDIRNIGFDTKTYTFTLPTVSLDVNTEVVLRNLVAYEASTVSGPLIFTRYTELMNGIIDTEEDVKLLREKGIVLNYMKSDGEIADLWNGMSKSVRLTRVPCLDQVIEDVNKYYSGRWKIKVSDFFRVYVFGSWRFLIFLAAIIFMLLMALQVFCTVYRFSRIRT